MQHGIWPIYPNTTVAHDLLLLPKLLNNLLLNDFDQN